MSAARGVTARLTTLLLVVASVVAVTGGIGAASASAAPADEPSVEVATTEAERGRTVLVTGTGWRPDTVVTLLLCGQNAVGGTEACANADSRAVTTGSQGDFSKALPVVKPPKACPCVVKAVTVTGEHAWAETEFTVRGHPVKPLPKDRTGTERLAVLDAKLTGSSGVLNWFGAPPRRQLVLTVANQGTAPAKNPVFEVGTARDVFAHDWAEQRWSGTLEPGEQRTVTLDVELAAGAHGDHRVGVQYAQTVLAEQPWQVGRPWGLNLLGLLLLTALGWALYRIGRLALRRFRPRARQAAEHSSLGRFRDRLEALAEPADDVARPRRWKPRKAKGPRLPWLAPDAPTSPEPAPAPPTQAASEDVTAPEPSPTPPPRP